MWGSLNITSLCPILYLRCIFTLLANPSNQYYMNMDIWYCLTFRPIRETNELKEYQESGTDAKDKVMVIMRGGREALW